MGQPFTSTLVFYSKTSNFSQYTSRLTESIIRRYFPHCEACLAGNMAQCDRAGSLPPSTLTVKIGSVWQVVIKTLADNSKARKHKRAIGGYTSAINCIDKKIGFEFGYLLTNYQNLEIYL